ncbi:amino acid adenylation domain-containing protein, partial [Clostridium estertheticum]|nr:amino acid adenylation domain-containing protein [Clostridium estertheticum]
ATYGATTYMTLLSAYNILLSRYSGQEDIIVGSPIAGRPHADLQGIVGMFVNTLAMRNYPKGEKTFKKFLQDVKGNALSAYENQEYQFDKLIEELDIRRDLSRNALFDTMFVLQNIDIKELEIDNLKFKQYEFENKISKFDLTLSATEIGEEIVFNMEYCTKLYKKETIERLIGHFLNILREVVENPEIKLSEIEMLSEEEKTKILVDFNDTKAEYPKDKTIHELFEEQVEKTPENIAVVYQEKTLTYRELNEKANSLARILREDGVEQDTMVGIMVDRSLEMIIGIMGILKAGGAYLPMDPEYPKERIEYMLEDSDAQILLTQNDLVDKVKFEGIIVDLEDEELYKESKDNLEKVNKSSDLAYVIYTSGSTGKPKGVMVEHKSTVSLLIGLQQKYPLKDKDVYLLKTNYIFDVSVTELFGWFFEGGKLIVLEKGFQTNSKNILEAIEKNCVTHINFVPSMLSIFVNSMSECDMKIISKLKYLFVAGEQISKNLVYEFHNLNSNVKLENLYGPTEATVYATVYSLISEIYIKSVPIGKAMVNTKIYILAKNNNIQPVGIAGELCILGGGLARGYLNRPELTAEKFVANPFDPSERMYRTGDLARWLPDGDIEYIGRIDRQVKIRGYRIELGEIENKLLKNEEIKEVVVIDREDKEGNKYLCAYITCDKEMTVPELRASLSKALPDYMIPAYFMQIEKMPLTPNGKLDRKALPEPDGDINTGVEYAAPRNEIEEKLVKVWTEVLGVERIGIDDDFFTLGGDSIKAIQVCARLSRYNLKITVRELFANPIIRELSINVKQEDKQINQTIIEGKVELTAIQRWFFERKFINMHHWNQSFMMYSKEG